MTVRKRKPKFFILPTAILVAISMSIGYWISMVLMADNDMVLTRIMIFMAFGMPTTLLWEEIERYVKWRLIRWAKTQKEEDYA